MHALVQAAASLFSAPSSHSSPASTVPSPQTPGDVVIVVVGIVVVIAVSVSVSVSVVVDVPVVSPVLELSVAESSVSTMMLGVKQPPRAKEVRAKVTREGVAGRRIIIGKGPSRGMGR